MAKTEERVVIPALAITTFSVRIVGDAPLICHAWSEKAKKMILDKHLKKS